MAEFTIKRGSRLPHIQVTVPVPEDGVPEDFSRITAVQFVMVDLKGVLKVDAAGSVHDTGERVIEYAWLATDTDTAGDHEAEFVLTFDSGEEMRVPTDGYIIVRVVPDKG